MIDITTKVDKTTISMSGVLDGIKRSDLPIQDLKEKKIHLWGKQIESWNTTFVTELYGILKNTPKEDITFESIPNGMERLLKLAFQAGNTPRTNTNKRLGFLERIGEKGIIFCRSVRKGCLFIHQCLLSWKRQLMGKAVYRSKDFWLVLADCGRTF